MGVEAVLPYLLRRTALSTWLGVATFTRPYIRRMWPHYWIGYLVLALGTIHGWIAMKPGHIAATSLAGLWLATAAWFLMLAQVVLGLYLQAPGSKRASLRAWHYWVMVTLIVCVGLHIWLNR
ncbi:MAG TPA: hypothetical protein VKW78_16985 [Terriglobales bacterium]|nr:hypothetical protein [Terriglobales bacterium]